MTALAFLAKAHKQGVRVYLEGTGIALEGPALPPALLAEAKAVKPEVVLLLKSGILCDDCLKPSPVALLTDYGRFCGSCVVGLPPIAKARPGRKTSATKAAPLDPLNVDALVGHLRRARPAVEIGWEDVQVLGEHLAALDAPAAEECSQRLWAYWKGATAPTVGDFLAREPKAKGGAA